MDIRLHPGSFFSNPDAPWSIFNRTAKLNDADNDNNEVESTSFSNPDAPSSIFNSDTDTDTDNNEVESASFSKVKEETKNQKQDSLSERQLKDAAIKPAVDYFKSIAASNFKKFKKEILLSLLEISSKTYIPLNYKQDFCASLREWSADRLSKCRYGKKCNFAHNLAELYAAHILPNANNYKKSPCLTKQSKENTESDCLFGLTCKHLHPGDIRLKPRYDCFMTMTPYEFVEAMVDLSIDERKIVQNEETKSVAIEAEED